MWSWVHFSMISPCLLSMVVEAHYVYSADMAEQLLTDLNYPQNKIERVVKCVYNHSGRNQHLRTTIEEHCVADGDALAHFDRIPSLFSLAYNLHGMSLEEGREYVKNGYKMIFLN